MLFVIIGIFAVVSITMLLLDLKTGWNGESYETRNNVVFAGRNTGYGAYELRNNYNKRVMYITAGVLLFSIALYGFKKFMDRPKTDEVNEVLKVEQIDLTPPPPVDEQPPPPPPPPPPPMVEMVKFTPPVIKDDAVEEEPQKLQEEVKETNVGTKDQEGEKDVVPIENTGPTEAAAPEIFTVVEEMPEFSGGMGELSKYLKKTIEPNYPQMAKEAGITGKCYLKFVVKEDGSINDVQILKGVPGCPECDKVAVNAVKNMPKWKPGKQNGRQVSVYYNIPINFSVK